MKPLFWIILSAALLSSCSRRPSAGQDEGRSATEGDAGQSKNVVSFKYAQLIHVEDYEGCRLVTVDNPWKPGKALHRYLLVPRDEDLHSTLDTPHSTLDSPVTVVRTPLHRSVIFTSVHAALACQLHAEGQIAGVADLKYMKVPYVQQGCREGRIADCGDGMSPLVETIIDCGADAILLSPFENSGGYGRLEDIGIPLIECAEYMEQSPLARAEWMRFYGMLYGQEARADSLFAVVDSIYQALKKNAERVEWGTLPKVLMDKQTGSVWYMPGGRSTIGRMLADAQCDYPFAADEHSGSLPLPFETVLEKAGESDVWLLRYDAAKPLTMSQLLGEQPGYRQLKPVQRGRVYGCNVSTSLFYEETPFRPDLLLRDLILILHSDTPNPDSLRYYSKVE